MQLYSNCMSIISVRMVRFMIQSAVFSLKERKFIRERKSEKKHIYNYALLIQIVLKGYLVQGKWLRISDALMVHIFKIIMWLIQSQIVLRISIAKLFDFSKFCGIILCLWR